MGRATKNRSGKQLTLESNGVSEKSSEWLNTQLTLDKCVSELFRSIYLQFFFLIPNSIVVLHNSRLLEYLNLELEIQQMVGEG